MGDGMNGRGGRNGKEWERRNFMKKGKRKRNKEKTNKGWEKKKHWKGMGEEKNVKE